jgi:hypothetical protein
MMQPGRKSAAANVVSLAVTTPRTVLTPIGHPLSKDERTIFDFIAKSNHHLKPIDTPLLMLYACAIVRSMARGDDFEKVARTAMVIARSLRLTPQSHTQGMTAARRRAMDGQVSYYEAQRGQEQDD